LLLNTVGKGVAVAMDGMVQTLNVKKQITVFHMFIRFIFYFPIRKH